MSTTIALIGDYNKSVIAHGTIPHALELACHATNVNLNWTWIPTTSISDAAECLAEFTAIWVVPGSPYKNMDGALGAIQFARENNRPFLGTCGGFQHALIEYARNKCGVTEADHAEVNPQSNDLIVTPLECSLVDKIGTISFSPASKLHKIFQGKPSFERYHCNYGLNPEWINRLTAGGLQFTGFDEAGEIRAFELSTHPFYIGTLFQPERSALFEEQHPLIQAFVLAAQKFTD